MSKMVGALSPYVNTRRCEVDRDPSWRIGVPGIADGTANALARLLERRVGEPDDREPGQARRHVDLDPDEPPIEAVERRRGDDRQHDAQPTDAPSPGPQSSLIRA